MVVKVVQSTRLFVPSRRPSSLSRFHATSDVFEPSIMVDVPPPRRSTLEPAVVPIIHSPAYYLSAEEDNLLSQKLEDQEVMMTANDLNSDDVQNFEENPLEWVLMNTDQMLNRMEKHPTQTTETIWKISNSPLGQGTSTGVRAVAKMTVKAGEQAIKMAIPLGTWALKEGGNALIKLLNSKE